MVMRDLPSNVLLTRVSNAVAAGQAEIDATGVDMQGYDAVVFMAMFGSITGGAVTSLKAQASDDDGSTDAYASNDLLGTSVVVSDASDNKIAYLEIIRPRKRYVRAVILRATQDSVVDGILALRYRKMGTLPVTQGTSVIATSKIVTYPAVGTP